MFPDYSDMYWDNDWYVPSIWFAKPSSNTTNVYKLAKYAKKPNRQVKKEKKYVRR